MVRRAPRTVLFLGNELTTTLDLNTALKKLKLVSVLDAFISAQTFLSETARLWLSRSGRTCWCLTSLMAAI